MTDPTPRPCCASMTNEPHALSCPGNAESGPSAAPQGSDYARAQESPRFDALGAYVRERVGHAWRTVVFCFTEGGAAKRDALAQQVADGLNMLHAIRAGSGRDGASLEDRIFSGGDPAEFAATFDERGMLHLTFAKNQRGWCVDLAEALAQAGFVRPAEREVPDRLARVLDLWQRRPASVAADDAREFATQCGYAGLVIVPTDDVDPPVCRLQFPDGSVPGNAREAAEGWHRWAQTYHEQFAAKQADAADWHQTAIQRAERIRSLEAELAAVRGEVRPAPGRDPDTVAACSTIVAEVALEAHPLTGPPSLASTIVDRFKAHIGGTGLPEPLPTHPVDALKAIADRNGFTVDPEWETLMRAICDQPVTMAEFAAGETQLPGNPIFGPEPLPYRVVGSEVGPDSFTLRLRANRHDRGWPKPEAHWRVEVAPHPHSLVTLHVDERQVWPPVDHPQSVRRPCAEGLEDEPEAADMVAPFTAGELFGDYDPTAPKAHKVIGAAVFDDTGEPICEVDLDTVVGGTAEAAVARCQRIADALNQAEEPRTTIIRPEVVKVDVIGGTIALPALIAMVAAQVERTLERRQRRGPLT